MKIAILVRRFITTGGAERYAVEVARRLAKIHNVHVFAQEWDHEPPNLVLHRVSRPFKKPSWLARWWYSWSTAKLARSFDVVYSHERVTRFDVMHLHCGTVIGGLFDPARATKKRSRFQIWLKILTEPSIWANWRLEKINLLFEPSRRWIAVSRMIKKEVQRYYDLPDDSFVIAHSGVDQPNGGTAEKRSAMRRQLGFNDNETVVLFVGTEFRRKGLDALVDAMGLLKDLGLKLAVIGGGNPVPFQERAAELGILEKIVWTGLVKNTSDYYAASDIYALPTTSDPSPLSPLEAMVHGCAVVMSCDRFNGAAEHVKNDESILLQNPRDSTEIAAAIRRLTNPAVRKKYAGKGRELAAKLSWDQTTEAVLKALEQSCREHQLE